MTKIEIKGYIEFWRSFKKNRPAVLGLSILIFYCILYMLTPFIAKYDPWEINFAYKLVAPNARNLLGTDQLGRDIFSRILWGIRMTLIVGIISASISAVVGIFIGSLAGYFGGKIDELLMRITEFFLVLPRFFLLLIIASLYGSNIWNLIMVIGLTIWPSTARLVRAEFLSLKERDFVEATRLLGATDRRIIFKHILPNALSPVVVNASFQVARAILTEAALSFLGLGDVTQVTWGQMLYRAHLYLRSAWWMGIFPGFAIFAAVLSFNLVGDGLNDALNPRLRER